MKSSVDVLDNVLGITDVVETSTSTVTLPNVKVPEEVDNDYKYQRENFYRLVERGQDAIDGILELAKESEHPRSYEVAGNLIKQVADVTEKLGDLQVKMQKLKEVPNKEIHEWEKYCDNYDCYINPIRDYKEGKAESVKMYKAVL